MGFGTAVRHKLGPAEPLISDLYRSRFINLDELTRTITSLANPTRILEVGCGEGAVAERLASAYQAAQYVGLDIAPEPGRMFIGDRSRFEFRRELSRSTWRQNRSRSNS